MRLSAWERFLEEPCERYLAPPNVELVGYIPIDRPISDWDEPIDDLLNLLPPIDDDINYGPSVWGPEAYLKSFEKFFYAEPCSMIKETYPREWYFANKVLHREFNFLENSVVIDITATSKNSDSTPAFPKTNYWKTEMDYLKERGYQDYIKQYEAILNGERPRVLWYLFLKKEILKQRKIDESDIRQIVCSDPIFARIGCCFEEHQNYLMKTHTRTRMGQCGWTPFFGGFKKRIQRLMSRSNRFYIEFDWTRYDGTIPMEVFSHIKRFRFSMLDPQYHGEPFQSVYNWYCSQIYCRHVLMPSGEVVIQDRGNPSGQISTTMDNNLVNVFLQAFEYAYIWPDKSVEDLFEEWQSVDSLVYGDDRLTTFPNVPDNYVDLVVEMYKTVFGMWVKHEKVRVQHTPVGLSFCGFTINDDLDPIPTDCDKLLAALVKPCKKLSDIDSLYGKLLCYKILCHNLEDEHRFKNIFVWHLRFWRAIFAIRVVKSHSYLVIGCLMRSGRGGPKSGYGV
uniref:Non-structural polyprotein 1AB n=1 Tax=Fox astrovirus TaxID=1328104 RepID=N0A5N0_9VIRU|nr:RNA-dependent RNA polymerase [Fox astrovirus]